MNDLTLAAHPAINVDLVTLILRDIEWVPVRIEAAVFGHGPTVRPLADAAFWQRVQEMLDVGHKPAKVKG